MRTEPIAIRWPAIEVTSSVRQRAGCHGFSTSLLPPSSNAGKARHHTIPRVQRPSTLPPQGYAKLWRAYHRQSGLWPCCISSQAGRSPMQKWLCTNHSVRSAVLAGRASQGVFSASGSPYSRPVL
ncbi:hypothetical protein LIA77_00202 [Sarocladium implicatum]|nr:hypothetical protein LIA77_00202 [Sarocladium implicatum]